MPYCRIVMSLPTSSATKTLFDRLSPQTPTTSVMSSATVVALPPTMGAKAQPFVPRATA